MISLKINFCYHEKGVQRHPSCWRRELVNVNTPLMCLVQVLTATTHRTWSCWFCDKTKRNFLDIKWELVNVHIPLKSHHFRLIQKTSRENLILFSVLGAQFDFTFHFCLFWGRFLMESWCFFNFWKIYIFISTFLTFHNEFLCNHFGFLTKSDSEICQRCGGVWSLVVYEQFLQRLSTHLFSGLYSFFTQRHWSV